jgi:hypothetical protein
VKFYPNKKKYLNKLGNTNLDVGWDKGAFVVEW